MNNCTLVDNGYDATKVKEALPCSMTLTNGSLVINTDSCVKLIQKEDKAEDVVQLENC